MFRTLLAALPLIAATANAQVHAEPYGSELPGDAMRLSCSAQVTADDTLTIRTEDGQPGAAVALVVGFDRLQWDLNGLGIDGYLLVDPIATGATAAFADDGTFEMNVPTASLQDHQFHVQALSIAQRDADEGPQIEMSNGVELRAD